MRGTEVVFNQLRIFAFVVSLFALCCVRVESSLSIEKPDGGIRFGQNVETEKISIDRSDFCMTQFLRAENWRGKILQEILNKGIVSDETVIDGDSLKRSLWKTVPQMLYDFRTSTGWFAKNLITANGYIDFGEAETVGRFSSSELIYVLLANALVLDAMNRFKSLEDIACPLNVYYGQVIFSRELIKSTQKYIKVLLAKREGNKVESSEIGMISTTDDDYTMENKFGVIRTRINSNFNLLRIMNKEDDQAASIIGDNGKYTLEKLVGKPNKKQLQQVFFIEGKLEDFFPMKTELSLNEIVFYKQADGNYYQDSPFMDPYKETGKGYVKILTTLITESQIFPGRSVNQIQWFIVPIQSHGLEEYTQMIEGRDFSKMEVKLKKAEDIENWASWFTRLPVEIIKKVRHIFFTNDMGFTIELNERYFETLRRDLDSKLGEKLRNPIHLNFNSSNGPNPFTMPCIYECFGSSPFIKQFHEWAANETIDVYVY